MKRCIAPLLAIGFLALTLTANSVAQDKKKKDAPELSPELKLLKELTGSFEAKVKMYKDPEKSPLEMTGSMERKIVLEGTYLQEKFKGKFSDKNFAGLGMIGYDPGKKQYVMTWFDSMSPIVATMQGAYDADKKTYTFVGDEIDPKSGKKMKAKDVLKVVSADEQTFEMYRTPQGTPEFKVMDITYTRTKKVEKKKEEKKDEK